MIGTLIAKARVKKGSFSAKVTRADGTVENLGEIATMYSGFWEGLWIRFKRLCKQIWSKIKWLLE